MNCWFGYKSREDLFARLDKQLEISNGYPSIKNVLESANSDWTKAIALNVRTALAMSTTDSDTVPTLEAGYAMLGEKTVRLAYLEQVAIDLKRITDSKATRCKEVEGLMINCQKQLSLLMEMCWAITEEGKKNELNEESNNACKDSANT